MTPLFRRRVHNFKANRRGFWSLWIFLVLFVVSLGAEFIANDDPLLVRYDGRFYFPIFRAYPETTFGGVFPTETVYRDPAVIRLIQEKGWILWPPIPFSYDTINYDLPVPAPAPPSRVNWLGTDDQGRDLLARLIYGFRISVLFGLILTALSSVIGILAGAVQGYFGGWVDLAFQRFIEIWSGLPVLYLLIILASVVEPNFWWLLGLMLLFSWMALVGVVRAEFLPDAQLRLRAGRPRPRSGQSPHHVAPCPAQRHGGRPHLLAVHPERLHHYPDLPRFSGLRAASRIAFAGRNSRPGQGESPRAVDRHHRLSHPGRDAEPARVRGRGRARCLRSAKDGGVSAHAAPLLRVRDLSVSFSTPTGELAAVRKVSLDLDRGETLALVGESGSGKSVTALSIVQLLPYPVARHPSGSIEFRGRELLGAKEQVLRAVRGNRIAMIFQEPMTSLNPFHTIEKQVNEVLLVHKHLRRAAARARTLELLRLVGLSEAEQRLGAYPHQLSGGQRQRVMIAMALANEPDLLIADEPTTALDVTIQAQILDLLRRLQRSMGMALLLITHDLGIVRSMAARVCVMTEGEIVEAGPTAEIFERPQHPYTRRLVEAEPRGAAQPDRPRCPGDHGRSGRARLVPSQERRVAAHGGPHQGGGRRLHHRARRPDGRCGGRKRLGQDHPRAGLAASGHEPRGYSVRRA